MEPIEVVAAALMAKGTFFTAQRATGPYAGCWEFPGGKIEPGETPEEALRRELYEELGMRTVNIDRKIGEVTYEYPEYTVHIRLYLCPVNRRAVQLKEHTDGKWLTPREMRQLQWLKADHSLLKSLSVVNGGIKGAQRALNRQRSIANQVLRTAAKAYAVENREQGVALIKKVFESMEIPGWRNFLPASTGKFRNRPDNQLRTAWDLLCVLSRSDPTPSLWEDRLKLAHNLVPRFIEELAKTGCFPGRNELRDAEEYVEHFISVHHAPLNRITMDWMNRITYDEARKLITVNPRYTDLIERLNIRERLRDEMLEAIPERIIDLFPLARALKRHFILHVGPTNSGKTHDACEALRQAESGMYLGPLRLLAYEQYDRLNRAGCPCTLLTGEEKIKIDGAAHVSSTVEMADLDEFYSVVVIDEAQMVSDPSRGGAWTAAILGVASTRIHVCMAPCALKLVISLIEMCEDTYEIVEHKRQVPLVMEHKAFDFPQGVEDRDALIVFSKKDVHAVAIALQKENIKCSIVYGDLPYDVRENEARRFATGETRVVVATDAIGTGLNLPIRRIVFLKGMKFDGTEVRGLLPIEIQQIAGRAGRFGMFETGYVNALPDIHYGIEHGLNSRVKDLDKPYIRFPEHLIAIRGPLSSILEQWNRLLTDERFNKESIETQITLCRRLEEETDDKRLIYRFITIPFDPDNPELYREWRELFEIEKKGIPFDFETYFSRGYIQQLLRKKATLPDLELVYRQLDLLHYYMDRFGHEEGFDRVVKERKDVSDRIIQLLSEQKLPQKVCKVCGRPLPWYSNYSICESCYYGRFRPVKDRGGFDDDTGFSPNKI